jgi:hypothetical protein
MMDEMKERIRHTHGFSFLAFLLVPTPPALRTFVQAHTMALISPISTEQIRTFPQLLRVRSTEPR